VDTAKNLVHLEVVKDMVDQEVNVLKEILLTDPTRINSAIDIWTKKKQKESSEEEKARCDKNIANLYNILEKAINTTISVYNIETEKIVEPTIKKELAIVHQPPVTETVEVIEKEKTVSEENRSKTALRVVKDEDDLATKYANIIKSLSIDDLKKHFITLTQEDATEAAHYILSNGLYHATNPKKWEENKINGFLKEVAKAKLKKEKIQNVVNESISLDEKYKDSINKYTLAEIGEKIRNYVSNDKATEALEFATYILSKKAYIDAEKEDIEWTLESITTFIDQVVTGMSSEVVIEDAKVVEENAPFWDITYNEIYSMIDKAALQEGATLESVKNTFVEFMNANTEKSIEKIDDLVKESNLDTVWNDLFAQTIEYRISVRKEKEDLAKFEKENVEQKETILEDFCKTNIIGKKTELEEQRDFALLTIKDLKKRLVEAGWKNTDLTIARDLVKKLAEKVGVNVKYFIEKKKEPEQSPSPSETETNTPEKMVIIGPQVSVDNKFPEIKEEIENAKYLEDVYFLSKKYITDEDKNAYVLQLIANAFADKKVFETANSTEPLDWTIEQVQTWLNSGIETEKPLVDAQTDINPKIEETPVENAVVDPKNEWKKIFCAANKREKFINAVVDFIKKSKDEGKDIKTIRSETVELIQYAARNNKKSFARSSYKNAQEGELHNTINKIAINAEIEGFMNEPKH